MQTPIIISRRDEKSVHVVFNPADPLYVMDFGWHKTPPSHVYGPAVRPFYLLHLIDKGKGEIERNGVVTKLGAGDAFWIRPDETTVYRADPNEPWEYYWISFYGTFSKELFERTANGLFAKCQKSGIIALQTAVKNEYGDTVSCLNTLFEVLSCIRITGDEPPSFPDVIANALQYLENNYFRDVDIASLSSQLGFSRAYFTTLFTKKTGDTPYNYLTKIRISKAKQYLLSGSHSIEEIAYSVGFSCIGRFSELFKKHTGVSPLQFRKAATYKEK